MHQKLGVVGIPVHQPFFSARIYPATPLKEGFLLPKCLDKEASTTDIELL